MRRRRRPPLRRRALAHRVERPRGRRTRRLRRAPSDDSIGYERAGGPASRAGRRWPGGRGAGGGPAPVRTRSSTLALGRVGQGPGVRERARRRRRRRARSARPGRDLADSAERPDLAQLPGPRVEVGGEAGSRITPSRGRAARKRRGSAAQSSKSAGAPKRGHAARPARPRPPRRWPATRRCRSPASHTPSTSAGRGGRSMAARRSRSQPASEKSPSDVARAPEVEREHRPAGLGGQAVGQLGIGLAGAPATAGPVGEAVAEHEAAARRARCAARRAGQVWAPSLQPLGIDPRPMPSLTVQARAAANVARFPGAPSPPPRRSARGSGRRRATSRSVMNG